MQVTLGVFMMTGILAITTQALAHAAPRDPYANLFTAQLNGSSGKADALARTPMPKPSQRSTLNAAPIHTVVCGMTVIQGDAKIDTAIAHHPPKDEPKPIIGVIQPAICIR